MSQQEAWENPNDTTPKKQGTSGCAKVVLIGGGIGLVLMLICCGVGAYFAKSFMPTMVTSPAEVAEMSKQMVDMKIPDDFKGVMGMKMDNFFMTMQIATFEQTEKKGFIQLIDMKLKVNDPNQKAQFRNNPALQQQQQNLPNLKLGSSNMRDFDLRGQPVTFRFTEAVNTDTNKNCHVIDGTIDGPNGFTTIKLIFDDEIYDEDTVVELIESIK